MSTSAARSKEPFSLATFWRNLEAKSALCIAIIISLAPFWRGLFFQANQLAFSLPIFAIGILWFFKMQSMPKLEKLDWAVLGLSVLYVASNTVAQNRYQALCWGLQMSAMAVIYFILSRELMDRVNLQKMVLHILTLMNSAVALVGISAYTGMIWGLTDAVLYGRLTATFQYPNTAAAFFNVGMVLCLLMMEYVKPTWQKAMYSGLYVMQVMAFFLCRSRIAFMQFPVILLGLFLLVPWRHKLRVMLIGGTGTIAGMLVTNRLQALYDIAYEAGEIWSADKGLGIRLNWNLTSSQSVMWSLAGIAIGVLAWFAFQPLLKKLDEYKMSTKKHLQLTYGILGVTVLIGILIVSSLFVPSVSQAMQSILSPILPADLTNAITNISSEDQNYTSRIMFIQNGIQIGMNYPWFGTGGGGYASVYSRYQPIFATSRFTHSQPFQVLSETGFPGFIAYLAMWGITTGMCLIILWKSFHSEEEDPRHLLLAGLLPAVWAIGAHSTFDFDLTYISMQMQLYVLMALIAAVCWSGTQRPRTHALATASTGKRVFGRSRHNAPLTAYLVPIILAFMIVVNVPMLVSENIVESLTGVNDPQQIIAGYESAISWTNFNSNMLGNYTRWRINMLASTDNQQQQIEHLRRALELSEMAVANDSLNPDTLYYRQLCYFYTGDWAKGVSGAFELAEASPYWPAGYELAATSLNRSFFALTQSNELHTLRSAASNARQWEGLLEDSKHGVANVASLQLCVAMANAIEGRYDAAERYALLAVEDEQTVAWAGMLIAAIAEKHGLIDEANQLLSSPIYSGARESAEYQAMLRW